MTLKILRSALLYTGLAVFANAALAQTSYETVAALRAETMKKLVFHSAPRETPDIVVSDAAGTAVSFEAYEGRYVLLNFWATWCAPCRKEMPGLAALETEFGGEDFAVVTVATGPNPVPAVNRFMDEIGVDNLPRLYDPRQKLAREMGILGLPVTVLLDREGQEVARLIGDADWHGQSARDIIKALVEIDQGAPEG